MCTPVYVHPLASNGPVRGDAQVGHAVSALSRLQQHTAAERTASTETLSSYHERRSAALALQERPPELFEHAPPHVCVPPRASN